MRKEYTFKIFNTANSIKIRIPNIAEEYKKDILVDILRNAINENNKSNKEMLFYKKEKFSNAIESVFNIIEKLEADFEMSYVSKDEVEFITEKYTSEIDIDTIENLKIELIENDGNTIINYSLKNLKDKSIVNILIATIKSLNEVTISDLKQSLYDSYEIDDSIDLFVNNPDIIKFAAINENLNPTIETLMSIGLNIEATYGLETELPKIIYKIENFIPSKDLNYKLYENDYRDVIYSYILEGAVKGFYSIYCDTSSVDGKISYTNLMPANELTDYIKAHKFKNISDEIENFKLFLKPLVEDTLNLNPSELDIDITVENNLDNYTYTVVLFDKILFDNKNNLNDVTDVKIIETLKNIFLKE